jgi:ribonucleoside-diphosphate reductase alpha chain
LELEQYFKDNQMAVDVVRKKYCHKKHNGEAENIEEMFSRVASGLAAMEPSHEDQTYWADKWLDDLMTGWYRPGGSILSGVGHTKKVSLINCTTLPLAEDSIEAIAKCNLDMMKCAARRQGLGVDVSKLRPKGATVNNSAEKSTGAIPWMDWLASMGNYVGQLGRVPAILMSIKDHHPDVMEFCLAKSDLNKIQNANISVQISNEFMEAVKNDADWNLYFETHHEKIEKTVKAREIFELISSQAHKYAEPGVQFIDLMRKGSMIHQIYEKKGDERFKIISTNACSEKPLPAYGNCVLGSLNMAMFPHNPEEYKPILEEKVYNLTRMLDNSISYEVENELYGVSEQKEMLELVREIGMGFTNLHEWFMNADVQYDSDEAIQMVGEFQKWYAYYAVIASQKLAEEKGAAGAYESTGITNRDLLESTFFKNVADILPSDWIKPLRNLALLSVAPTGTLSLTFPQGCLSTGAEPLVASCWWKKTRALNDNQSYDFYFELPKKVKEYVLSKITDPEQRKFLESVKYSTKDNTGEYGKMVKVLIDDLLGEDFFKPAHLIDPSQKVKLMGELYKYTDACVSITFNIPENATVETVQNIYQEAYDHNVRAVSVYRDGSREGILIFDFDKETKEEKPVYCSERPDNIVFNCAPKRPADLSCEIHHCKVQGKNWLVIVGLHNEYPYEVFAGEYTEDMYVPKTVKEGILRKVGKSYSLIIPIRKSEVEYKDIASVFMNAQYRSLTRMISLSLRHGVRPAFITDQLKKADEGISEFSSVVSRVLNKYMKSIDYSFKESKKKECQNCGPSEWIYSSGCEKCANCGVSKCD